MNKVFYPLKGFESYYEISKCGIVRSKDRNVNSSYNARRIIKGKEMKPDLSNKGYFRVPISISGVARKKFSLHRLLAINFIPNPNNLPCVNHKDSNPLNNDLNNLEWCTQSYNIQYKFDRGYTSVRRSLSEDSVIDIYKNTILGKRGSVSKMISKYKTSKTVIYGIIHNKTYLNITSKI